jgi:hypothetical protein
MRTVAWFSAGAASTCATRLALKDEPTTIVAYCDPGAEHADTRRYINEAARWLGVDVLTLRSEKYVDIWDVFDKTGYLVGTGGARCTTELKKLVRRDFQRDDDRQVFGFTFEERKRADQFRKTNPEVDLWTPLIDERMTKRDCHAMIREAGIEPHFMYQLGYKNANCVGCVKGGMGYWNKIRVDFPDVFQRMTEQERKMGIACNREEGPRVDGKRTSVPVFLDELDPKRGHYPTEPDVECGVICPTQLSFDEGPLDETEQSIFDLFDAAATALERRSVNGAYPQVNDGSDQ